MNAPTIPLALLSARTTGPRVTETQTGEPNPAPVQDQRQPSMFDSLLIPGAACVLVFWFIIIRPEKRQRKAREEMLSALQKGDEVITSGGIHGRVAQVKEDVVTVQVADGVRLRFTLNSVQSKANDEEPAKVEEAEAVTDS